MPSYPERRYGSYAQQREEVKRRQAAARPANPLSDDDRVFYRETSRATLDASRVRRASREDIIQSYAAQDAQRARDARMYTQNASRTYQEHASQAVEREAQRAAIMARQSERDALISQREQEEILIRQRAAQQTAAQQLAARPQAPQPLSSEESYQRTRTWQENYEFERESRDAFTREARGRSGNREIIDGRGSIDSRAFNERQQLVGYSIDERDKPSAMVDTSFSETRWHSRAGQGFDGKPDSGARRIGRVQAMAWSGGKAPKPRAYAGIPDLRSGRGGSGSSMSSIVKVLIAGVLVILAAAVVALIL